MGCLKRFVQENAITGRTQAITEFNIFYRRMSKAFFVKSAHRLEYRSPNSPASSPKCRSFRVAVLVHEMVAEIPILRHEPLSPWLGIIGAEDSVHVRMLIKNVCNVSNRSRRNNNIGIDEKKNFSLGMIRSIIPRCSRADVLGKPQNARAHSGGNEGRIIGRGIIHNNDFATNI